MRAEYIIKAIEVLNACEAAFNCAEVSPTVRGEMIAKCWMASMQLRVHSGIGDTEVEIVADEVAA